MGIVKKVKELIMLAHNVKNIELHKKLVSLQSDISLLQNENCNLKETVRKLQEKYELRGNVVYEKPFYWLKDGDKKEGPYCQKCYDSICKLIHLQSKDNDIYECLNCNRYYEGPKYVATQSDNSPDHIYRTSL